MLEIDKALLDMLTAALDEIRAWVEACNGRFFAFDDVNWDSPTAHPDDAPNVPDAVLRRASHAIGFVCGVAAGLDVTPLSLLWAIGIDTETPILAAIKPPPCRYCQGTGIIHNTVDLGQPPTVDCDCPAGKALTAAPAPTNKRRAKRSHAATVAGKPRKVKP